MKTNSVIYGDNVKVLGKFKDEIIDLVVTSPPYDNIRKYEGYDFDFEKLAVQLYRVLKQNGIAVWIVNDSTKNFNKSLTSFKQCIHFQDIGFNINDIMTFEKSPKIVGTSIAQYFQVTEYMFVMSKGKPGTVNLIKDRMNSLPSRANKSFRDKDGNLHRITSEKGKDYSPNVRIPTSKVPHMSRRTNIWHYDVGIHSTDDKFAYEHPAIFPEKLAYDHIISWSNPGDLVLDPFCGSGTVLKMAKRSNRNYIGIDISQKYCGISRKRVKVQGSYLSSQLLHVK